MHAALCLRKFLKQKYLGKGLSLPEPTKIFLPPEAEVTMIDCSSLIASKKHPDIVAPTPLRARRMSHSALFANLQQSETEMGAGASDDSENPTDQDYTSMQNRFAGKTIS